MLRLADADPRHTAVIGIPERAAATNEMLDEWERVTIREYQRAKAERPNLGVKIVPATEGTPGVAIVVLIHEHRWVGGRCVNGCTDTRDTS
jgi:uridine phosphorylase